MGKPRSSALQRRIQCYPPPGLHNLLMRYAESHGMSNSEAAVHMVRSFFNPQVNTTSTKGSSPGLKQN